ncbi:MAG: ATP-binding cassette domain-containing protein [Alphaproteobacteria bacterium]
MSMLKVQGLCLQRQGETLLDQINFQIDGSGLTFVLGANGAGKSLLLRQLHQLGQLDGGSLRWHHDIPDLGRRFIFQKPVLLNRSVEKNMQFVAKQLGVGEAEINSQLNNVGLADKKNQRADLLSGGEQQKLAFARETLGAFDVLMLDEPTANLDPQATLEIESLIQAVINRGKTVIMASHDLHQIQRLSAQNPARVLFLEKGKLIFDGSSAVFFSDKPSDTKSVSASIRQFTTGIST